MGDTSDIAIRVENLCKLYHIGRLQQRHDTLRDALVSALQRSKAGSGRAGGAGVEALEGSDEIWALRGVSFEVKRGEVVGIIGRNGAGKSTLLKILSRITEPTTGRAEIHGRVGSLLEVGTGFHPELTGRENIYLNGAILGMRRVEIDRRFDEIVAFAEIEKFLDTPVKRYSSGMYVRLAFEVAAHLEPEILLVDEVLAVGDVGFQKKCLGKMRDVARIGRTVFFVSHNMAAVTRLCGRAVLLDGGKLMADGNAYDIVSSYVGTGRLLGADRLWDDLGTAPGDEVVRLRRVCVKESTGNAIQTVDVADSIGIEVEYDVLRPGWAPVPNLHFFNDAGICLFVSIDLDPKWRRRTKPIGRFRTTACIPANLLSEGTVIVGAAITTLDPWHIHLFEEEAVMFQVTDSLRPETARGDFDGHLPGAVRPKLAWTTIPVG
jgi:lipopolysaccharide transport system ATP-binding protein